MTIPPRPQPLRYKDPESGRLFEVRIDVHVFRAYLVHPRSDEDAAERDRNGPLYRIIYCASTYDLGLQRAELAREELGIRPERIEWVHADKEELQAFRKGDIVIRPVREPKGA